MLVKANMIQPAGLALLMEIVALDPSDVKVLRQHQMIPSMSRPANPYDNTSCESFIKMLNREEIYANYYRDLEHLRTNHRGVYRTVQ